MIMIRRNQVFLAFLLLSIGLNLFLLEIFSISHSSDPVREKIYADTNVPRISPLIDYYIKQNLIFVVGSMSSGTTLMRLILDTHPEINCGDETKVIELLLSFIGATYANPYYVGFMSKTGVQNSTVERAVALFIYYIMENNYKTKDIEFLKNVKYLCNKEPMNMNYYTYLHRIFPNARFLYVIRDGRDMIYSYMRRNNLPMNFNEFHKEISNWNRANAIGLSQCTQMGPSSCLMVKYESLVSDSEQTIKRITQFLGVDFVEDMLHHDDFMKTGRIIIGKEGFIRNGVQQKKINNRSVGYNIEDKIVGYDRERIAKDITLLKHLNYI